MTGPFGLAESPYTGNKKVVLKLVNLVFVKAHHSPVYPFRREPLIIPKAHNEVQHYLVTIT